MTRILYLTNGSGFRLDRCMRTGLPGDSIALLVGDHNGKAFSIAKAHNIESSRLTKSTASGINQEILSVAKAHQIDYILSVGFTRIIRPPLLDEYRNRIFNSHPSMLPAFRGFYDSRDTRRTHPARNIFERTLESGALRTGNTIHVISEDIDEGYPVLVSTLSIPYEEDPAYTRHRLFTQECQTILQFIVWLREERVKFSNAGRPRITDAKFLDPVFAPNLDCQQIIDFKLDYPWQ